MGDDELAKSAYEEMLRREGVHPSGAHAWDGQAEQLRNDWRGVVRLAVAQERERCARLAEEGAKGDPHSHAYEFGLALAAMIREGRP